MSWLIVFASYWIPLVLVGLVLAMDSLEDKART
jgi:L-cystine uptake protein TcyP (sodium:dicarboxylate symporter family)